MDHRPFAILFALATFATPALAADIDEVTAGAAVSADADADDALGLQERSKRRASRNKGAKRVSASRATRNGDTRTRVRATNGTRTAAAGRNVTTTRNGQTRTTTRSAVTTTQGNRPVQVHSAATRPAAARHAQVVRPATPVRRSVRVRGTRVVRPVNPRRTVTYRRVTPAHGVFVYGPQRRHHHHYHGGSTSSVAVQSDHMPTRAVDRTQSLAVGIKAGTFFSGTQDGDLYSDFGLGGMARYRPAETVGLQFDVGHHAGSDDASFGRTVRHQTQLAGSVDLFAFPWAPVSPYVLGGVTYNGRSVTDREDGRVSTRSVDGMWGLHGGLGLELALGQTVAIDLEGRYVGWLARDTTDPLGALQGNVGLLFHF